jgi:hypothetical protein
LGGFDEEEPDGFGDGVSHVPDDQFKVGVNSSSDLLDEEVVALLAFEGLLDDIALSGLSVLAGSALAFDLLLFSLGGDDVSSVCEVV